MKYFYDPRRDSYRFTEEPANFFVNVGLQVTRRCNMKCVYCSEAGAMADAGLKEIKKMVDKLVANGLKRICITGGEPLLRSDLVDILKYIKGKGVTITLSTNGSCLGKKILKKMVPYIDNIRFSIRGTEKIHDQTTGVSGSFGKTIEAIKMAKEVGLPVSVVSTVISANYDQMAEVAETCERNKVDKLYFFTLIPRGRAAKIFEKENVTIDKVTREFNRVMETVREKGWNIDIRVANFTIEGECVLVFPNGDVVGVPSFTDKSNEKIIGNILNDDPKKMWQKYPFKENYINYYRDH